MQFTEIEFNTLATAAFEHAAKTGVPVLLPPFTGDNVFIDDEASAMGDRSVGTEASVQYTWATGNPAHPYVTATTTYYVTAALFDANNNKVADLDINDLDDKKAEIATATDGDDMYQHTISYAWDEQTEIISHSDPIDPGSTQIGSAFETGDGSSTFIRDIGFAHNQVVWLARNAEARHYNPSAMLTAVSA